MDTHDLNAIIDTDGRLIHASPALRRLLGHPDDGPPDGTLFDAVHPDSRPLIDLTIRNDSAPDRPFGCRLKAHDGTVVWTYARPTRQSGPDGDTRTHLAFTYPAPASRAAPDRRHADDVFRAFFENAFDAAFLTEPSGAILEANAAATTMFGYGPDELRTLGRDAVVDTDDPRLAALLRRREATGTASGRLTMRRADGSRFEADLASSVFYGADGTPVATIVVRDLTDRLAAEQAERREGLELARRIEALAVMTSLATTPAAIHRALLDYAMAVSPAEALLVAERRDEDAGADADEPRLVDVYAGWDMGGAAEEEVPPTVQSAVHHPDTLDLVLTDGRAVVVHDLRDHGAADARRSQVLGPPDLADRSRAALLLPMTVLGDTVGVAEFRASTPGAFGRKHAGALRVGANLAAIAVNDLRRHEREQAARRRAEAGWRHLRELVDQAPVMMATAEGPDHVFTSANRRYLDTLGLSDIVGKPVRDVLPEIEAQGVIAILDQVYASGEPFVAEGMPMDLSVNGEMTRFYFNLTYQPIRDGDGRVTGILANVADVTGLFRANEALETANAELREAYDQTIRSWGRALDIWDHDTAGHSQRVTDLAVRLATRLGVTGDDLTHLRWGAQLHDIGKMAVPTSILLKPGKLDPDEWELMKTHTTRGADFLEPIAYLKPALAIPRSHHERWDGTGYPGGLAGHAIPLPARIFAIVDVYDALTSDRPYRDAWTPERALAHIRDGAGTHFDPDVAAAFAEMMRGDARNADG